MWCSNSRQQADKRWNLGVTKTGCSEVNLMFETAKTEVLEMFIIVIQPHGRGIGQINAVSTDYNHSHTNKLYVKDGLLVYQNLFFSKPHVD
jgi:hypothetical protein